MGRNPPQPPFPPVFVLVTGNPGKLREAERVLGFRPESLDVDLPEIQSLDAAEVLEAKGEEAWRRLGRALVVEEAGLGLRAMNGFPGPLVKWMLEAMGPAGLGRAALALGDAAAEARCLLLYRDGDRRVVGCGRTPGRVVAEPRGEGGFGWDVVFVPDEGDGGTFAELPGPEKDRLSHRGRAWRDLLAKLG